MTSPSFTGRGKRRTTRRSVLIAERAARLLISIGGVGTIVAVSLIMVFLTWVVLPLWNPAELGPAEVTAAATEGSEPLAMGVDEDRRMRWALDEAGALRVARLDDGALLETEASLVRGDGAGLRSFSAAPEGGRFAAGYADGRVVLGHLGFANTVFAEGAGDADVDPADLGLGVEAVPEALRGMPAGELRSWESGVVARMSERKLQYRRLEVRTLAPVEIFPGAPVERLATAGEIDFPRGQEPVVELVVAALSAGGQLTVRRVEQSVDFMSGELELTSRGVRVEGAVPPGRGLPAHLALTALGDHVLLVWPDGYARHYLYRSGALGLEAELDLLEGRGGRVTALTSLLGETTVLVADDSGGVSAWFPARAEAVDENRALTLATRAQQTAIYEMRSVFAEAGVPEYRLPFAADAVDAELIARLEGPGLTEVDRLLAELPGFAAAVAEARAGVIEAERQRFVRGTRIELPSGDVITALASSPRSRLIAVGTQRGQVALAHVTTANVLGTLDVGRGAVGALSLAPKEDLVVAALDGGVAAVEVDPGHPEVTFASLFLPVWYEGLDRPAHIWQSTGGTDAFEPKLGLWPLVFGTLKATFYSMIFGAPLALLAAIYTSEFLKPRLRATVKSLLELMASLPSVVLGFLAALVIAPYVQDVLPSLLAFFMVLPFTLVLGANLWQLMPRRRTILWSGWQRFAAISIALPAAVWLAGLVGPLVEELFFAGNLELWLDGQLGTATGGWLLLFLPLAALIVFLLIGRYLNPRLRILGQAWEHETTTRVEVVKFLGATLATIVIAVVLARGTTAAGFDPRGGFVDTYVQRNALVVGFVMGFAVIPIIYTLAEDALSSVPGHLRLASLGCGATPWQTAVRVIVPTAMSGLFSAVMIGLGRAVGETMIVLMAAGNTPVTDWNVFNGFRTLSANIAVELPEAARDTTHYRVLFLAALTLFVMTFALNTLAEMVRSRFRKRAFQL